MTWTEAHKAWDTFLSEVEETKYGLHCSYSNAWFRGQSNTNWKLNPSLFRLSYKDDTQFIHKIKYFENDVKNYSKTWQYLKEQKSKVRKEELWVYKEQNDPELAESNAKYDRICQRIIEAKKKRDESEKEIKKMRLLYPGEREAFNEYSFRSGRDYRSSWETLAEMQHHGVPTRLLDWSEVLAVGLYFALNKYYKELNSYWNKNKKINHGSLPFPPDDVISRIKQEPSIWVLNPYKLSEKSTGDLKIWDLTLDKRYDYFDSFLVNQNWPFDQAIPMYSPWRNARIASQQGMFTVSGHEKNSLSEQFSSKIIREVKITPMAAIYGVRMLRELLGIDNFMIFRDLDTLGAKVKKQFFE